MGSPQVGLAVLATEIANDLTKDPRCQGEPGVGLLHFPLPGSKSPHPVTQLPREFPHARSLGSLQTHGEQIPELGVIEPLLMEDFGGGKSSRHRDDQKPLLFGPLEQRFDVDETRPGASIPRASEMHFDLDPPEILWIPGFEELGFCFSK